MLLAGKNELGAAVGMGMAFAISWTRIVYVCSVISELVHLCTTLGAQVPPGKCTVSGAASESDSMLKYSLEGAFLGHFCICGHMPGVPPGSPAGDSRGHLR